MKNVLLISFEIGWGPSAVERDNYNRIYTACEQEIQAGVDAADYWGENTTFYVVRSDEDSHEFLTRVWRVAAMRKDKDRLVVLDAGNITGRAAGAVRDASLYSLLPCLAEPNLIARYQSPREMLE